MGIKCENRVKKQSSCLQVSHCLVETQLHKQTIKTSDLSWDNSDQDSRTVEALEEKTNLVGGVYAS